MNRKRSLTKSLFIILVIIPALILMPLAFAQETAILTAEPSAQTLTDKVRQEFASVDAGVTPDQPFLYYFDTAFDRFQPPEEVAAEKLKESVYLMDKATQAPTEEERQEFFDSAKISMVGCVSWFNQYESQIANVDNIPETREQEVKLLVLNEIVSDLNAKVEDVVKEDLSEQNLEVFNEVKELTEEVEADVAKVFVTTEDKKEEIIRDIATEQDREIIEVRKEINEEDKEEGVDNLRREKAIENFVKVGREVRDIEQKISDARSKLAGEEELPFDATELRFLLSEVRNDLVNKRDLTGKPDFDVVANALSLTKEIKDVVEGKVTDPAQHIKDLKTNIEDKKIKEIKEDYESKLNLKEKIEKGELTTVDKMELLVSYYDGEGIRNGLAYDDSLIQELEQKGIERGDAIKVVVKASLGQSYNKESIEKLVREIVGNPEFTLPAPGTSEFRPVSLFLPSIIRGDPSIYKQLVESGIDKEIAAQVSFTSVARFEIEQRVRELTGNNEFKLPEVTTYRPYYERVTGGRVYDGEGNPIDYDPFGRRIDPDTGAISDSGTFYSNYRIGDVKYYLPPGVSIGTLTQNELVRYALDSAREVLTSEDFSISYYGGPYGGPNAYYGRGVPYGPPDGSGLGAKYESLIQEGKTLDEATRLVKEEYRQQLGREGWTQAQIDARLAEMSVGTGGIGGPGFSGVGDASPGALSSLIASTGSLDKAKETLIQKLVNAGEDPARAAQRVAEAERTFSGGYYGSGVVLPPGVDASASTLGEIEARIYNNPEFQAKYKDDPNPLAISNAAREQAKKEYIERIIGAGGTLKDAENAYRSITTPVSLRAPEDEGSSYIGRPYVGGPYGDSSRNTAYQELINAGLKPEQASSVLAQTTNLGRESLQAIARGVTGNKDLVVQTTYGGGYGYQYGAPGTGYTGIRSGLGDASPVAVRERGVEAVRDELKRLGVSEAEIGARIAEAQATLAGSTYGPNYGTAYTGPGYTSPGGYSGSYASVGTTVTVDGRTYTVTADRGWTDTSTGQAVPPPQGQPSSATGGYTGPGYGGGPGSYSGGGYYGGSYGAPYSSYSGGYSGGYSGTPVGSYSGGYPSGGSYPSGGYPSGGSYPSGGYPSGGSYPSGGYPSGGSYPSGGYPSF